jgi:hypothetical protein
MEKGYRNPSNAPPIKNDKIKLIIRIMGELNSISYNAGILTYFFYRP